MTGNIITRRDFNISRMKKEFPNTPIDVIANAQWELEMEYPKTNWEEKVYYDTGKSANKPSPNSLAQIKSVKQEIKKSPKTLSRPKSGHKSESNTSKRRNKFAYNNELKDEKFNGN